MRGIWTLAVTLQGPCHDADAVVDLAVPVQWPADDWGTIQRRLKPRAVATSALPSKLSRTIGKLRLSSQPTYKGAALL